MINFVTKFKRKKLALLLIITVLFYMININLTVIIFNNFYNTEVETVGNSKTLDLLLKWWNLDESEATPDCSEESSIFWAPAEESQFSIINCDKFKEFWNFPERPLSREEKEYPLAFVFMGYKNLAQTLRLFRAIYQPQNTYCVTWDSKSKFIYKTALKNLTSCFSNVITPEVKREIQWGEYTLLQATMDCLKELYQTRRPWNYVQILSWNDFPLKTNKEMVQIMKILGGSTDSALVPANPLTFRYKWRYGEPTNISNPIPPHNLVLFKGWYAVSMPRNFVAFLFENQVAIDFYHWLNNSDCPEEMYFSTLIHNSFLRAPGGFPGTCLQFYNASSTEKRFVSRFQVWEDQGPELCRGYFISTSCVFGFGDVNKLKRQYALVAHKLYETDEPAALYCLEEWHYQKIASQTDLTPDMVEYYSNMQSVLYHKTPETQKHKFVC